MQDELTALLGFPVDVVSRRALKDRDEHIRREAVPLLTRRDEHRIADILEAAAELRLIIAHQSHRVDPDQVWTIAEDHVPVLVDSLASG